MVVDRSARRARETLHECHRTGRIEVGGRLVQHQDAGARRQRAGQGQALLLPAGEAPRPLPFQPVEPDLVEHLRDPRAHRRPRPGPVLEAEGDVVLDPLHHELAVRVLPDHADPCRDHGRPEAPDLTIVEGEVTAHGRRDVARDEASDGQRERALAGPGWAHDEHRVARGQLERDAVQGQAIGAPMADREVACLERPRLAVGGRQSGNPSSTPARLSERCRTTDPPATITTAEMAMKTKRTAWTTGSTSA